MTAMRWGVIGVGDDTQVQIGPAFRRIAGSELVAVVRGTAALAKEYACRHQVPRWYTDAEAILTADDIDAVYIATPPNTHAQYTRRAATAGKAVLVERPMAVTVEECRSMAAACDEAGVPLWVAYRRRALPRLERVRQMIADGAIGEVRAVNSARYQVAQPGSGHDAIGLACGSWLFDAVDQTLDWLDHVFGPLRDVRGQSVGRTEPLADTVVASYGSLSPSLRGQENTPVGRIGKGSRPCRVSHLLHHRCRPGRTVPSHCHRGTLGDHHALLCRPHTPGD